MGRGGAFAHARGGEKWHQGKATVAVARSEPRPVPDCSGLESDARDSKKLPAAVLGH